MELEVFSIARHISSKKKHKIKLFKRNNPVYKVIDYKTTDDMSDMMIPPFLQHSYLNGTPPPVISELRPWQRAVLVRDEWTKGENCVIVAPTSGGKTVIAEVAIAQLLEDDTLAKAIYTLPFVALAAEKTTELSERFSRYIVRPFFQNIGGSDFTHGSVAVCTYEKAHSLLNYAITTQNSCKIKLVVIDEAHMIADDSRGAVVETLIMKLRQLRHNPRIVALTATLNEADAQRLAKCINGFYHFSVRRVMELKYFISTNDGELLTLRNDELKKVMKAKSIPHDRDFILPMVRTLLARPKSCSMLIFVNTRIETKTIALFIAKHLFSEIPGIKPVPEVSSDIKELRSELIHHLNKLSVNANSDLITCLEIGIGFHHAGMLLEERRIVERGLKNGALFCVVATTTLSAGVNIRSVQRVIIHSPYRRFGNKKQLISSSLFMQMSGRCGRTENSSGDVIVVSRSMEETEEIKNLILQPITNIESSLFKSEQIYTYILQAISLCLATDIYSLQTFMKSSFAFEPKNIEALIKEAVGTLIKLELMDENYITTPLGNAISSSNLSIAEGVILKKVIDGLMNSLCLMDDLHLLYLCTPSTIGIKMPPLRESIWERIFDYHTHVVQLITNKTDKELEKMMIMGYLNNSSFDEEATFILQKLYGACILNYLIDEVPIDRIENIFCIDRGTIQSLQTNAATYSGQATRFAEAIGCHALAAALIQFRKRLNFAVKTELVDLMLIPSIRRDIARIFYDNKITSPIELSCKSIDEIKQLIPNQNLTNEEITESATRILEEAKALTKNLEILEELEDQSTRKTMELNI